MDKRKIRILITFLKLSIRNFKNAIYCFKNYKKFLNILNIYEDEISKKYIKEYIRNIILYPLMYPLCYCSNIYEIKKLKKLVKFIKDDEFTIDGLKFNFPKTKFSVITPEVFLYHLGLKNLENNILNKIRSGNIIDCGAFIGDSSIILSRYTDHKVFALEPDERIFSYLVENIKKNNLDNKVIPINYGVGDKEETLNFKDIKLKITTIDNIVKKENIDNISLIKMDIEGYELKALKGAKKTIQKYKPVLINSLLFKGSRS